MLVENEIKTENRKEEIFVADLHGYSGCKLKIYLKEGAYFVRKISKNVEYNERLKQQMLKQDYFYKKIATENILTPKILNHGYIGNLFYFDMEYITGRNILLVISDASIQKLTEISQRIFELISIMKKNKTDKMMNVFSKSLAKIEEIRSKISSKNHESVKNIVEILDKVKSKLNEKLDTEEMYETFCHGDLTMENMIYDENNKKLYLIDYLDSYANHYWIDISKVFQDLEGKWYAYRNPNIDLDNLHLKMAFIENYLNKILILEEKEYLENHHVLLAVTLARIFPYADEECTSYLINILNFEIISKFK